MTRNRRHGLATMLLTLVLLLSACAEEGMGPAVGQQPAAGGQQPAGSAAVPGSGAFGTPGAPFATAPPAASGPGVEEVDGVFLQLLAVYQAGGLDAARLFARMQGVLTANDEVRMTLVLDTSEPSAVEGTALAVGRLGGRVTATYGGQIELVVPVQTLVEYSRPPNRSNFFAAISDFRHVRDVRRTPTAGASSEQWAASGKGATDGGEAGAAVEGWAAPHATDCRPPTADCRLSPAPATSGPRSEGVEITGAGVWHAAGVTGRGVKVGIIDVGFTRHGEVLGTQGVVSRSFREDGKIEAPPGPDTMHGTACAEIVREMAPDAEVYLAAAGDTPGGFVTALNWLTRTAGVRVVTTSIGFAGEFPADGTSDLARAVDEAKAAGVFFTKSAGNLAQRQYRAPFADSDADGEHDFPGGAGRNTLRVAAAGGPLRLTLNWDDWANTRANYDLFVADASGREVARATETQGRGSKRPVETLIATVPPGTYTVRVRKVGTEGGTPALTLIAGGGATLELTGADGTITVPGDARGSVTVGAVGWRDGRVPGYSSRGPTRDGRPKPELGAPEGVWNAAYALTGPPAFHGTSAAAPHVAGAAALLREGDPAATPDALLALLVARAAPTADGDGASGGAGRLDLGMPPQAAGSGQQAANPQPAVSSQQPAGTRVLARGAGFVDDFTAATSGLPAPGYRGGTYRVTADANALLSRFYPVATDAPDATHTVRAQRVAGAADAPMGLIVRAKDRDNYLLFVATNDGTFNVFARVDGSLRALLSAWTPSDAIRRDGPNALSVQATGTRFAFSVNGRVLTVLDIPDVWMTGGFGFAGGGGVTAGGEVAFTGYRVAVGT